MNLKGFVRKDPSYVTYSAPTSKLKHNAGTPSYLQVKRKRDSFLTPALEEMQKVSQRVDELLKNDS